MLRSSRQDTGLTVKMSWRCWAARGGPAKWQDRWSPPAPGESAEPEGEEDTGRAGARPHWRSEMDPSPTVRERRVMSSHRVQAEARRRGRQLTFHTYLKPIIILAGVAMLFWYCFSISFWYGYFGWYLIYICSLKQLFSLLNCVISISLDSCIN